MATSGDDGAVDVRENAFLHGAWVDRRDHGAVGNRDHEGRAVDQHQGVPRALGRGRVHPRLKAGRGGRVDVDPAPGQPLDRVTAEPHGRALAERAAQHLVERGAGSALSGTARRGCGRAADAGRRDGGVVADRISHQETCLMSPGWTWTPSTSIRMLPESMLTLRAVPLPFVPSAFIQVTWWPISDTPCETWLAKCISSVD